MLLKQKAENWLTFLDTPRAARGTTALTKVPKYSVCGPRLASLEPEAEHYGDPGTSEDCSSSRVPHSWRALAFVSEDSVEKTRRTTRFT